MSSTHVSPRESNRGPDFEHQAMIVSPMWWEEAEPGLEPGLTAKETAERTRNKLVMLRKD